MESACSGGHKKQGNDKYPTSARARYGFCPTVVQSTRPKIPGYFEPVNKFRTSVLNPDNSGSAVIS